jgi:quinol monooxygenase YgiN
MRLRHWILGALALVMGALQPLQAEEAVNATVYAVTYFDAAAPEAAQVAALARPYAQATRKEAGNVAFDVFEEMGRPNRFAIIEAWHDKAAYDAHTATPTVSGFHDKLQPLLISGTGVRIFGPLSVAPPSAEPGAEAVYVLTHVDVFPAGKDQAVALVKELAEAARKDPGNLWFDVLQQDGRPNHFTLFEGWRDQKAFEASIMAAHTKEFRQKLNPLEGALYDERLYEAVH